MTDPTNMPYRHYTKSQQSQTAVTTDDVVPDTVKDVKDNQLAGDNGEEGEDDEDGDEDEADDEEEADNESDDEVEDEDQDDEEDEDEDQEYDAFNATSWYSEGGSYYKRDAQDIAGGQWPTYNKAKYGSRLEQDIVEDMKSKIRWARVMGMDFPDDADGDIVLTEDENDEAEKDGEDAEEEEEMEDEENAEADENEDEEMNEEDDEDEGMDEEED